MLEPFTDEFRSLCRELDFSSILHRFAPATPDVEEKEESVSREEVIQARTLGTGWQPRRDSARGAGSTAAILLIGASLLAPAVRADGPPIDIERDLAPARALYSMALAEEDRDRRTRTFARAASALRSLAERLPNRPALLVDWGNAALGARDLGTATLAYRRALALDPTVPRARRNLTWVRENGRVGAGAAEDDGALQSLLFWRHFLTPAQRHLVAAALFALAVVLVVPWTERRRPWLRRIAILPALGWLVMLASVIAEPDASADVVVVTDGVTLRSADSPGAPSALAEPLPGGAEAVLLEERDGWTRIELAGATGWVQSSALGRVVP